MLRQFILVGSMAALVAACNANIALQPTAKSTSDKVAKPKASASVVASTAPSASPSASAPATIAASASPAVIANPFGVPNTISPTIPASVIATGGGNLIGQAGGNLIGQAGGNLIGQAGGNLIGQAGGNYAVFQAPPPLDPKMVLENNLETFLLASTLSQAILETAFSVQLIPGVPKTAVTQIPILAGKEVTGLLELKADHAILSVGLGKEAKGPNQILGISFTSPKKGKAVFYGTMFPNKGYIVSNFDLDAGTGTSDGFWTLPTTGERIATHWEVKKFAGEANGKAFSIQASRAAFQPFTPDSSGYFGMAMHLLKDDTGVAAFGIQDKVTQDLFTFIPTDGLLQSNNPGKPYAHYFSTKGEIIAADAASDALKALIPVEADIYQPFPAMPTLDYDPAKDPKFAFPQ